MSKKIVIMLTVIVMTIASLPTRGQQTDSAEWVVGRYMAMMNYDALPSGQMLMLRTCITSNQTSDTAEIVRFFAMPHDYRIELWQGDTLYDAWHNDGFRLYRHYEASKHEWVDASQIFYYDHVMGYDFRGPLYHRHTNGATLTYGGTATFEGHTVYRVESHIPGMYDRDYYFEQQSGLLFLYTEHDSYYGDDKPQSDNHIDWHSIEEYMPVGRSMVVSQETYQQGTRRTTMRTTAQLMPRSNYIFVDDYRAR